MAKSRSEINKDRYERTKAGLVKFKPYITKELDDKFNLVMAGKARIVLIKGK